MLTITAKTKLEFAYGGQYYDTAGACLRAVINTIAELDDDQLLESIEKAVLQIRDICGTPEQATTLKSCTSIADKYAEPLAPGPKKRGRKPKEDAPVSELGAVTPKRRGPKPKAIDPDAPVTEPKRRGPKPKAIDPNAAVAEPKKRGPKPKVIDPSAPAVEPKKRGRKPKAVADVVAPPMASPVPPPLPPIPPPVIPSIPPLPPGM